MRRFLRNLRKIRAAALRLLMVNFIFSDPAHEPYDCDKHEGLF